MTISKDLFLSILAMDSYNQGYGRGLEHDETQIGSATVLEAPENIDQNSWENAGFYAVSYTIGAGVEGLDENSTVISYRGTNTDGWNPIIDAIYGYGTAIGDSGNDNTLKLWSAA